jgi:hypothetical protein
VPPCAVPASSQKPQLTILLWPLHLTDAWNETAHETCSGSGPPPGRVSQRKELVPSQPRQASPARASHHVLPDVARVQLGVALLLSAGHIHRQLQAGSRGGASLGKRTGTSAAVGLCCRRAPAANRFWEATSPYNLALRCEASCGCARYISHELVCCMHAPGRYGS